jgi:hypothetical protein
MIRSILSNEPQTCYNCTSDWSRCNQHNAELVEWNMSRPLFPIILRHICSKRELWSQKKCPLLGNSTVTYDRCFLYGPCHVPTESYVRNKAGTVGSGVFYMVRATFLQQVMHATMEELLEAVFSIRSVPRSHSELCTQTWRNYWKQCFLGCWDAQLCKS